MPVTRHALVAYVRDSVGQFVEDLRRELHPKTAHMAAHVTILPPRTLCGPESAAREFLEEACSRLVPFDIDLGDVATFLPVTPTVYIEVKQAASHLRAVHDQLSSQALCSPEDWPFCPHLTIAKVEFDDHAREAYDIARQRWSQFQGPRKIHVAEMMFVREDDGHWHDVAPLPLGHSLLSPQR